MFLLDLPLVCHKSWLFCQQIHFQHIFHLFLFLLNLRAISITMLLFDRQFKGILMIRVFMCSDNPQKSLDLYRKIKDSLIYLSTDIYQPKLLSTIFSYEEMISFSAKHSIKFGIYFIDKASISSNVSFSLNVSNEILKNDPGAQLIFLTPNIETASFLFEYKIRAIDCIYKSDLSKYSSRFTSAICYALKMIDQLSSITKKVFSYKIGRQIKQVNANDILCISTTKYPHKLQIICTSLEDEFVGDLKNIDNLSIGLAKVSRSCLVNPQRIQSVDLDSRVILLENNVSINLSRNCVKNLSAAMHRLY